jgi:O-antigen/teichoic acid export membrane protein
MSTPRPAEHRSQPAADSAPRAPSMLTYGQLPWAVWRLVDHRRRNGKSTRGWALGTTLVLTSPVFLTLLAFVIFGYLPPIFAIAALPSATGLVALIIILTKPQTETATARHG